MKLLKLSFFATLLSPIRSYRLFSNGPTELIPAKKICKDCKHYIGDNIECRKFGHTNLITGKVTYDSARSVRESEKKCGENAIYFEENKFKIITVPYYFLKENWLLLIPAGFASFYTFTIFHLVHK